jgi:RimJ/RimL family protein N-acetyltransferase
VRRIITDDRVARFVESRYGGKFVPPFTCAGVEVGGDVIGGAVFNVFTGQDIHMSAAGEPRAWSRRFLRAIGIYVFRQLGCARITVITEQPAVAALAERLGGKIEGVKRDHFGQGRDAIMIGILAGEWRF